MRTLHLVLERGFTGESLVVLLAGREVYRSEGLPSDLARGFSAQVDVPLSEDDPPHVTLFLPDRGIREEIPIPGDGEAVWLVARLTPGRIVHRRAEVPPGYA